jgi:hypothetical protein
MNPKTKTKTVGENRRVYGRLIVEVGFQPDYYSYGATGIQSPSKQYSRFEMRRYPLYSMASLLALATFILATADSDQTIDATFLNESSTLISSGPRGADIVALIERLKVRSVFSTLFL